MTDLRTPHGRTNEALPTPTARVRLATQQVLADVIGWLADDRRPFVLSGEWFGVEGCTILGSEPVRVADPRRDDPFALLDEQPSASGAASIGGGWVGWLGYGLGGVIEEIPPSPPPAVPLPSFGLGFYDHVLLHDGRDWFFETLGDLASSARLQGRLRLWQNRLARDRPSRDWPSTHQGRERTIDLRFAGGGARSHLRAVAECTERIAAGDLFQANLCLRLEGRFGGDPLTLFSDALAKAKPRMGAYVDGIVSLSPERFIRRTGRRVTAEPIKGTRPRATDPQLSAVARTELEASRKDAAELVMIVDLMRNDLGRVCRYGSVVAEPARTESHAGVWHTVATVSGVLRDEVRESELLRATFPPGSVTGAPKVQAMKTIAALESTRREVYTGAMGMVSPVAGLDLNVAIRTFETGRGRIWLGVGGGIVAESDPDAELSEALTKAAGPAAAIGASVPRSADTAARRSPGEPLPPPALCGGRRPEPAAGIFETILGMDRRAVQCGAHLSRLRTSLEVLYGVTLDDDRAAAVTAEIERAARTNPGACVRIRVRASATGELDIGWMPQKSLPHDPLTLVPFTLAGGLGAHKWQDRALLEQLTARASGSVPLIVDSDGSVLEAAHANVWITEGTRLVTPPADGRLLAGVTRADLLGSASDAIQDAITLRRMREADSIFLTSSISGRHAAQLARAACAS